MKRLFSLFALWIGCAVFAFGGEAFASLANARRAEALLGPDVWSRLIRIENTGDTKTYPHTVHALVFELAGILWFYTDVNGTQSFSLYRGRLDADKTDFAPLLADIHEGFSRWTEVPSHVVHVVHVGDVAHPETVTPESGLLRNGCFVESVAFLRTRLLVGGEVSRPQLLSFYVNRGLRSVGHTVLTFETKENVQVFDPAEPESLRMFRRELASDAVALGSALVGGMVSRALWVPVSEFSTQLVRRYATLGDGIGRALD